MNRNSRIDDLTPIVVMQGPSYGWPTWSTRQKWRGQFFHIFLSPHYPLNEVSRNEAEPITI